jgi:hypothetical protein
MKPACFSTAALFLLLSAAAGADPPPQSVMVTWGGSGPGMSQNWGSVMATSFHQQLGGKYPCGSTLAQDELYATLDNERKRQLLGGKEDPGFWAEMARQVNVRTVIHITFTPIGGDVLVNVMAIDSVTAKVLARQMERIPNDGKAFSALDGLAAKFAGSLGASIPTCKGKGWSGSVTIAYSVDAASPNGKEKQVGSGSLMCSLSGNGSAAKCSYSSSSSMQGEGGTVTWTKTAKEADTEVTAGLNSRGKLNLTVGSIQVMTTMNSALKDAPSISTPPVQETFRADSYEVPAGPDPNQQSGSYSPPEAVKGFKVTISWSLRRAGAGSR